jgi:hypothetical protein
MPPGMNWMHVTYISVKAGSGLVQSPSSMARAALAPGLEAWQRCTLDTIVLMTSYDDSNLESRCKETQVPNIHSLAKKAIRMPGAVPIPSDMKCGQLCSCLPTLSSGKRWPARGGQSIASSCQEKKVRWHYLIEVLCLLRLAVP